MLLRKEQHPEAASLPAVHSAGIGDSQGERGGGGGGGGEVSCNGDRIPGSAEVDCRAAAVS